MGWRAVPTKETGGESRKFWTPSFLGRPAFISFLALYTATICSLIALRFYSARNNGTKGLGAADPTKYYAWTFGPTLGRLLKSKIAKEHQLMR